MHLTNYAINKKNKNYDNGDDETKSSKWSIASVMSDIEQQYGVTRDTIWNKIKDIINKTIISAQPELSHIYKAG